MSDQPQQVSVDHTTVYNPSADVVSRARVKDWDAMSKAASADPEKFWAERAHELEWYQEWDSVLDSSNAPYYKWFSGGKTNIVHNAIDRHLKTARKNKVAYIWQGEDSTERTVSYAELDHEVSQFANVLKSLGVQKGDRVTIYMGRVIELPVAMLACAKIGAVHSVVYGGFSVEALRGRITDSDSKVLVTCDGAYVSGKVIELKQIVDDALSVETPIKHVVVYKRVGKEVGWVEGRDHWWHDVMKDASPKCDTAVLDAEDPLFILYTSGSTGKPKALLHTHGGYSVYTYTTLRYVFDVTDEDRWWCAADPGWITGHSYIVYSPLINGVTSIIYEGGPSYPAPDRWWRIVEQYGVTILYCAPRSLAWRAKRNLVREPIRHAPISIASHSTAESSPRQRP